MQLVSRTGFNNIRFGMTPASKIQETQKYTPSPSLESSTQKEIFPHGSYCYMPAPSAEPPIPKRILTQDTDNGRVQTILRYVPMPSVDSSKDEGIYVEEKVMVEDAPIPMPEAFPTTKKDISSKNRLTLDKDGNPYTGEVKTRSLQSGDVVLTYEDGLLTKSSEVYSNGTVLEKVEKFYTYDENHSLKSIHSAKTTGIYTLNPKTGRKEEHSSTQVNTSRTQTKNGSVQEKMIVRFGLNGNKDTMTRIKSQMALLEDNTFVNLKKVMSSNGEVTETLTFMEPDGTKGEMNVANGTIKTLTLPAKNGKQVEIEIPDDEPGVVIKKIFEKDGVTTERWSSEIFPELISTFKESSIHRHYFNSSNQRKSVYQVGDIHRIIQETDYCNHNEKFKEPHTIIMQHTRDLKEKLAAANELVPFIFEIPQ